MDTLTSPSRPKTNSRRNLFGPSVALLVTATAVAGVFLGVDLAPKVEGDFFFSREDPQLRASLEIEQRFPGAPQVLVRAGGTDLTDTRYRRAISELSGALREIDGVTRVTSIANTDPTSSPLWSRVLTTPDSTATNIILEIVPDAERHGAIVSEIEAVTGKVSSEEFDLRISGVPFVLELIRRNLFRDLIVFSSVALVLFGALVALVYRRWQIVAGTLAACLTASSATLVLIEILDISIGLLTANIATIVFVLTLSHIVFLTSNWKGIAQGTDGEPAEAIRRAKKQTMEPSFWAMVTTLLGFLSLLIASAKPLKELGFAGAIGALTAMAVAYTLYPVFLVGVTPRGTAQGPRGHIMPRLTPTNRLRWLGGIGLVGALGALGTLHVSTDPSLLSYFAEGSELREGLEAIDRDGGSSPLSIVVADSGGRTVDQDPVVDAMWRLQRALEEDHSVGVILSPAVILAEIQRQPFMGSLSWETMLNIPFISNIAGGFIGPGRREGLFLVRMREAGRTESRNEVLDRIETNVLDAGLRPVLLGGLYDLQGQLGRLIASSLRIGLGGLLILFAVIGLVVSRRAGTTVAMVATLSIVPLFVLGVFGHAGMAVDIISAPGANVALAMGVDSMIHLVVRTRRLRAAGAGGTEAWVQARDQLWYPIVGAALIICAGFGIFSVSTFPPTQRFGFLVILGTLAAATMALVALPLAVTAVGGRAGVR